MLKYPTYILHVLCIVVLMCGYFLSDQPDRLSVMHFNLETPVSISGVQKNCNQAAAQTVTEQSHKSRSCHSKYVSYNYIISEVCYYAPLCQAASPDKTCWPHHIYDYLFFKEINPPPPRTC